MLRTKGLRAFVFVPLCKKSHKFCTVGPGMSRFIAIGTTKIQEYRTAPFQDPVWHILARFPADRKCKADNIPTVKAVKNDVRSSTLGWCIVQYPNLRYQDKLFLRHFKISKNEVLWILLGRTRVSKMHQIHTLRPSMKTTQWWKSRIVDQQCEELFFFNKRHRISWRGKFESKNSRFRRSFGSMLQQLAVRFPPLSSEVFVKTWNEYERRACHLSISRHVQGSGPFSTIGWIARTLGTEDMSNETSYETFPCVWNDSDITDTYWYDITWFTAIWWTEALTKPLQFSCHTSSAYSTCFARSRVRVFGSKPCAALRVEVCRWRGGSCGSRSSCPVFESLSLSAQGPATSDAATETAQNLATLTRAAKCSRTQDRNIRDLFQRIVAVVISCNSCLVYQSHGAYRLQMGWFLLLVTTPSSPKLRHGSERFLWCCHSSRGRKNLEVDLGEISWNSVKALTTLFLWSYLVCVSTLVSDVLASEFVLCSNSGFKIYTIVRITPCYRKAGFPCPGPHWQLSTHGK